MTLPAAARRPRALRVLVVDDSDQARRGLVVAESERSAVVYGMPHAAASSGAVDEVLELEAIAARLERFSRDG